MVLVSGSFPVLMLSMPTVTMIPERKLTSVGFSLKLGETETCGMNYEVRMRNENVSLNPCSHTNDSFLFVGDLEAKIFTSRQRLGLDFNMKSSHILLHWTEEVKLLSVHSL